MPSNNSKGNILIVDDPPENLRLLVGVLNEKGYQTRPVPQGKLALSAAQLNPPDLILLYILVQTTFTVLLPTNLKPNDS